MNYITDDKGNRTYVTDEMYNKYRLGFGGMKEVLDQIYKNGWNIFDFLADRYGLTNADIELLKPYIESSASQGDVLTQITNLISARQAQTHTEEREDSALSRGISQQLANGINPNLSGAASAGSSPASPLGFTPPGESSNPQSAQGSLTEKAQNVFGTLFKVMTLGLQGYSAISDGLMKSGLAIAGVAAEDVSSILGNDEGIIEDVPTALADMLSKRGFTGRKKRVYMQEFLSRVNSAKVVSDRLKLSGDILNQKNSNFEASVKSGNEYQRNLENFIVDGMRLQAFETECDLKIAQEKEKYRVEHNLTEQELELALRGQTADVETKEKGVQIAEEELQGKKLDNTGKRLDNSLKETRNASAEDEESLAELKRTIVKERLKGIGEMIQFCHHWEELMTKYDNYTDMGFRSRREYDDAKYKYKEYRKRIDYWYNNRDEEEKGRVKLSVPGLGEAAVSF